METIDRVAELIVTLGEFSELLDKENAAIQVADADTIAGLSDRKQFLSMHYQRQMRMLADRQVEIGELDPRVRRRLGDTWASFNTKKEANLESLRVVQDATRHVVSLMVEAIRQAQSGGGQQQSYAVMYKDSGAASATTASSCVSITYNRVL